MCSLLDSHIPITATKCTYSTKHYHEGRAEVMSSCIEKHDFSAFGIFWNGHLEMKLDIGLNFELRRGSDWEIGNGPKPAPSNEPCAALFHPKTQNHNISKHCSWRKEIHARSPTMTVSRWCKAGL